MSLTLGSLFSGIGGLELGLERAGFVVKWQCECDSYALRVLEKHWKGVLRINDVRDVRAGSVPTVDCICGGFPCQPVSVAGRRKGQSDARWLWPEFARVLDELRPAIAVLENVPGLLSIAGSGVAASLAALGFDAEWHCFSALSVGAWHKRERWFCVATDPARVRFKQGGSAGLQGRLEHDTNRPDSPLSRTDDAGCSDSPATGREPAASCCTTVSDTACNGRNEGRTKSAGQQGRLDATECGCCTVSDSDRPRLETGELFGEDFRKARQTAFRANRISQQGTWAFEPDVGRVAYGVPDRVDRLRCLGNAVVPQVAELIGRMIVDKLELI